MGIFDSFLLEAIVNGLLFGGVLALLALGLNLVFGVIDVVWICYAELIMLGMYTVYFLLLRCTTCRCSSRLRPVSSWWHSWAFSCTTW